MTSPKLALETFLTGLQKQQTGGGPTRKDENSASRAWRTVILTVLNQIGRPVPENELADRSELPYETFRDTLQQLRNENLVTDSQGAFQLTEAGHEEAEQARSRLLSS